MTEKNDTRISGRIASCDRGTASESIRDRIRKDEQGQSKLGKLRKLLEDGLGSGISERTPEEIIAAAREKFRENASDAC